MWLEHLLFGARYDEVDAQRSVTRQIADCNSFSLFYYTEGTTETVRSKSSLTILRENIRGKEEIESAEYREQNWFLDRLCGVFYNFY